MGKSPKLSREAGERAVRMAFEVEVGYPSQWAAIEFIAGMRGCAVETLRRWVRRASGSATQCPRRLK